MPYFFIILQVNYDFKFAQKKKLPAKANAIVGVLVYFVKWATGYPLLLDRVISQVSPLVDAFATFHRQNNCIPVHKCLVVPSTLVASVVSSSSETRIFLSRIRAFKYPPTVRRAVT